MAVRDSTTATAEKVIGAPLLAAKESQSDTSLALEVTLLPCRQPEEERHGEDSGFDSEDNVVRGRDTAVRGDAEALSIEPGFDWASGLARLSKGVGDPILADGRLPRTWQEPPKRKTPGMREAHRALI